MTTLVCRICGYTPEERLAHGAEPGRCPIPREVGKDPRLCWLNAGELPPGLTAGKLKPEPLSRLCGPAEPVLGVPDWGEEH